MTSADLEKAALWFDKARGRDQQTVTSQLDEETWRCVPFTHKTDLRADLRPYWETGKWITKLWSSGTTAESVGSPWSEADQQVADATARRVHADCPSLDGVRCAVIVPDPSLAVAHSMCREIELSGGTPRLIRPSDPDRMCRALSEDEFAAVFTLPMVASRLGEYFRATQGATPPRIQAVFCGGDVLSRARQAMLADIWDARVVDLFGCSEMFGPVAGPSEHGAPLAWRCAPVAVEVVDESTLLPCGVGERGVLVLTTLWPKASPLLRYWTDDIVEVTETASAARPFSFHYVGRPPSMLNAGDTQVALRDIDDVLLASGSCGSEWSVRQASGKIRIDAEMADGSPDVAGDVAEALREIIPLPFEFMRNEPGSLPRDTPKFAVRGRGDHCAS